MIAKESIYTDAKGAIVAGNDPRAAFLLVGKGSEIPQDVLHKYGDALTEKPEKSAPKPKLKKK